MSRLSVTLWSCLALWAGLSWVGCEGEAPVYRDSQPEDEAPDLGSDATQDASPDDAALEDADAGEDRADDDDAGDAGDDAGDDVGDDTDDVSDDAGDDADADVGQQDADVGQDAGDVSDDAGDVGDAGDDTDDVGDDAGEEACEPTGLERCDGVDNDCDGVVDEEFEGLGEACALSGGAAGVWRCGGEGLVCELDPEAPLALPCGELWGRLPARAEPYVIACEEVVVPAGQTLELASGARVVVALPDGGEVARLVVRGRLRAEAARLEGVSVWLDPAAAPKLWLRGTTLAARAEGQVLVHVPNASAADLDGQGVRLEGAQVGALGLVLEGALGLGIAPWREGVFSGLKLGVSHRAAGELALEGCGWEEVEVGVELDGRDEAAQPSARLSGSRVISAQGPSKAWVKVLGDAQGGAVVLEGAELAMRDHDAALLLDPDALPGVQAAGLEVLGEGAPWVLLEGSLDRVERLEVEVLGGVLGRYGVRGELVVAPGAVMVGPAPLVWEGEAGARLVARGQVALQGAEVVNLPVRVEDGGVASLGGARLRVEGEAGPDSGCLVEVVGAGVGALEEATLEALPEGARPALRGVCLVEQGGSPRLSLAVVRGFGVGVEVDGGEVGGWVVAGVRFEDNLTGLWVKAEAAPRVEGNEFVGRLGRSTTAVRFEVGASPGGAVVGNRFELGRAGQAYHLDPDNWAQPGGTAFGPNVWTQRQPSGYLLSGEQDSALAVLGRATELGPQEALLNDVQVVSELRVREGAALRAWGTPEDVLTLSGVQPPGREFVLAVEGRLEVEGPGVFVTELPLVFEAGSQGWVKACSLDGALVGLPLLRLEDAAPSVGGASQFDGAIFTGDNTRAVAGLEIEASAPMCDGEAALCPFVANNRFRSLAVGVRLVGGGALEGVNDFDDANPEGDTVPINVERR